MNHCSRISQEDSLQDGWHLWIYKSKTEKFKLQTIPFLSTLTYNCSAAMNTTWETDWAEHWKDIMSSLLRVLSAGYLDPGAPGVAQPCAAAFSILSPLITMLPSVLVRKGWKMISEGVRVGHTKQDINVLLLLLCLPKSHRQQLWGVIRRCSYPEYISQRKPSSV